MKDTSAIDAYDISVVATQLEGGVDNRGTEKVDGTIEISTSKQVYDKDEIIEIQVKGVDLRAVNAFSFALPYNQQDYENDKMIFYDSSFYQY